MNEVRQDFDHAEYSTFLEGLRQNGYLTGKDIDILLDDFKEKGAIYLVNVSYPKAEVVRKALLERALSKKA